MCREPHFRGSLLQLQRTVGTLVIRSHHEVAPINFRINCTEYYTIRLWRRGGGRDFEHHSSQTHVRTVDCEGLEF